MSLPITTVKEVYRATEYDQTHIIVDFKGKEYRVQKSADDEGLSVFTKRGRGYHILKSRVGEGIFTDMLRAKEGLRLPAGFKQK